MKKRKFNTIKLQIHYESCDWENYTLYDWFLNEKNHRTNGPATFDTLGNQWFYYKGRYYGFKKKPR